jgi:hypothetical protein
MKKVVMMLAMASFMVFFIACGGKKASTEATDEAATTETETVAPASSGNDVLTQYEEFATKAIELLEKGDQAGYLKLAQDYAPFLQEFATKSATFTEADVLKVQEISQKLAEAASKAYGQ